MNDSNTLKRVNGPPLVAFDIICRVFYAGLHVCFTPSYSFSYLRFNVLMANVIYQQKVVI